MHSPISDCPWAPSDPAGLQWRRQWFKDEKTARREALRTGTEAGQVTAAFTFVNLARSVALMYGLSLTDPEVSHVLWEETGYPGFFAGEPQAVCTRQLHEAFAA